MDAPSVRAFSRRVEPDALAGVFLVTNPVRAPFDAVVVFVSLEAMLDGVRVVHGAEAAIQAEAEIARVTVTAFLFAIVAPAAI